MAIAFVQKATATGVGAVTITTPAFASGTTVGNVVIGCCSSSRSAATNTFVFTDSKTNTWVTNVTGNNFHSGGNSCCNAIGSATLATGKAGTSHTITCTAGSGTNGYQLVAGEFSGLTTTVDKTATATGANSSTSMTATTAATTNANDLVVGIFAGDTDTTATGVSDPPQVNGSTTGVVSLQVVAATTIIATEAAYSIVSSTATQAVKWTYSADATGVYCGAVATFEATAGGDVTVALTGQGATSAAGSLGASASIALTGQSATLSAGTVVPGLSLALVGTQGTLTSGLLAPSSTVSLSGQSAIFTSGTMTAASGDVTVSLTGQAGTFSAGALTPLTSLALNGQPMTASAGSLLPALALGLTGTAITSTAGTLAPATATALSGQGAGFTPGQLGVVGDVTVALTGATAVFTAGTMRVSLPSADQLSTDAGRARRTRSIYRVTIDGQTFEFRTLGAALNLLDKAKEMAARLAQEKARAAIASKSIHPLSPPKITAKSPALRAAVIETKREIAHTYQQASIDIELALLMELDDRTKHNEDALFLLM